MESIKSKYMKQLSDDFQLLSEIVLRQLNDAHIVLENSEEKISLEEEIERNERLIDSLDVKLREEVLNGILLFNPKAMDLRKIMAYHDMTIYLERIGDLSLNVCHFLKKMDLDRPDFPEFRKKLIKMLKQAEEMVRNAVFAFVYEDTIRAYDTISSDDKLDHQLAEIMDRLHFVFQEKSLCLQDILNVTGINSVSYNLERIGDNATNIAESAVYLTEGKDIRHKE